VFPYPLAIRKTVCLESYEVANISIQASKKYAHSAALLLLASAAFLIERKKAFN
jgi:hypothetical protein